MPDAVESLSRTDGQFERAVSLQSASPMTCYEHGRALQRLNRHEDALRVFDKAINLNPDCAQLHIDCGEAFAALGHYQAAIDSYEKAAVLGSLDPSTLNNYAKALRQLRRFDDALRCYNAAIELAPHQAELHNNLGNVLQYMKRFDEAIDAYRTAISLRPDSAEFYNNLGVALKELKRLDESLESFDTCLARNPKYPDAIWNRALVYLTRGQFDIGWMEYEERKRKKDPVGDRKFDKPLWSGQENVSGKTILVYAEQGLGDVIQFCRYAGFLQDLGARVLLAVPSALQSLMRGIGPRVHIVDPNSPNLLFDFHCPIMSLPLAFKIDARRIPPPYPIAVNGEILDFWRNRLGKKDRARIGIVWRGSVAPDPGRSIDLDVLRECFDSRFELICLQKEVTDNERTWLDSAGIYCPGRSLVDFSDTAALCLLVDLVISIDTSVAHLAGTLGVPVWLLLPWFPDWRWMLCGDHTPWYPSIRLFRQKQRGDWGGVVRCLCVELGSLAG